MRSLALRSPSDSHFASSIGPYTTTSQSAPDSVKQVAISHEQVNHEDLERSFAVAPWPYVKAWRATIPLRQTC